MKRGTWIAALIAAAAVGSSAWGQDRVLVIPFNVLNVPAEQQWIGKGVEESLVAQLGQGGVVPVAFTGPVIVEDNATAVRLARDANAAQVIRGTAQVIGENVRLTAQVIDSKTGETVRTGLVTGKAGDLLKLEDELAGQLRGETVAATGAPATAPKPTATAPVTAPPAGPAAPPIVIINQPPAYYPSYPSYPYAYNYPYGWYPWGYSVLVYQTGPVDHGRGRGHEGRGGGGPGPAPGPRPGPGPGGGYNPNALPLPTNNVLPIPTNHVLPLPTNNVLPLPTNRVAPIPAKASSAPRENAGQIRNPLVN